MFMGTFYILNEGFTYKMPKHDIYDYKNPRSYVPSMTRDDYIITSWKNHVINAIHISCNHINAYNSPWL
jgi:hypothetical protein